ncbi:hypothetical protein FACS1894133_3560 [Clostridia bacterium]|nr:hypothetical protein FACS1894133_3560 [Clostridia bacterium]
MKYKGFEIKITPQANITKNGENGVAVAKRGYEIKICDYQNGGIAIDTFTAVPGYELPKNPSPIANDFVYPIENVWKYAMQKVDDNHLDYSILAVEYAEKEKKCD